MGLSIHYTGRIKNPDLLPEMIDEIVEIVSVYEDWTYFIFENQFPDTLTSDEVHNGEIYGIQFGPEGSEAISMSFLSNGRLAGLINLQSFGEAEAKPEIDYLYSASTKTQFSSPSAHKMIIHLVRYISQKYLDDFELIDEGQYWETGDEALLEKTFKKYNQILNDFELALETIPKKDGVDLETHLLDIVERIRKREAGKRKK